MTVPWREGCRAATGHRLKEGVFGASNSTRTVLSPTTVVDPYPVK